MENDMPTFDAMTRNDYTPLQWARYYKNVWNRQLAARTIDVLSDTAAKAANPDEMVQHNQSFIRVAERLEHRKMLVQDALDLLKAIDAIIAMTPEDYQTKCLSTEALAVAEDMLPPAEPEAKVGDVCDIDGKPGTLQPDGKGGFTCVADETPAAPAPAVDASKDAPAPEAQV